MAYSTLVVEIAEGIATIRLNRPERLNAMSRAMKCELAEVLFQEIRNEDSVRCVILTGTGSKAFCAGADVKEQVDGLPPEQASYHLRQKDTHALFTAIEEFEKPIIAAINGFALGGGLELALCCDLRIACDSARFGLPEAKIGVVPAAGGTQRLPRLIGAGRAKEMMFTGTPISAARAYEIGLVNDVVLGEKLWQSAKELATYIVGNAPLALRYIKHAVNTGSSVGIAAGLEYERYAAALVMASQDRQEGMRAFVEKRAPVFRGK